MATNDTTRTDASDANRQPRTPTVGEDPRDSKDTPGPAGKVWFRDLDEAVIEAGRCIQCGSCVAACPSDSIGVDDLDDRPTLVKMCTGCSRCWDNCPRSGLRYERLTDAVGETRERTAGGTYAVSATEEAIRSIGQDGAAITALLVGLLEAGEIDGAVVARESEAAPLKGEAHLATTAAEVRAGAGSFYNQTMQLGYARELIEAGIEDGSLPSDPDVALVGTPCVIQGANALSEFGREGEFDELALTIALFCTRSFEHDRLTSLLVEHGVDPADVGRLDVADGTLHAFAAERGDEAGDESVPDRRHSEEVLLEEPVGTFDAAGLDGCAECADFTGEAADVSVGNVGSPDHASTVVVRSERGVAAMETAGELLNVEPIEDEDAIRRIDDWNRRNAAGSLPRPLDSDGALTIGYEEHRDAYDGTDRAPEPHNPARVYQYERWC
jgi:coenzyme F420 hydrogenase subunit beta